jgi:hypothetical protein
MLATEKPGHFDMTPLVVFADATTSARIISNGERK